MNGLRENQTAIILDSIADGVFTVDSQFRISSFNRAAEKITGIKKKEALGRHCWEVFRASICETQCSLQKTMKTGKPIVNHAVFIVNNTGDRVPISISTALLRDETGKVIGGAETFRDLSVVEQLRKDLGLRDNAYYLREESDADVRIIIGKDYQSLKILDTLP